MKISIIAIIVSLSAICFAQDAEPAELNRKVQNTDTITLTTYSTEALKELTTDIQEIQKAAQLLGIAKVDILNDELQKQYAELSQKVMLIVSAYIDPKDFVGLTEDQKIIKRK